MVRGGRNRRGRSRRLRSQSVHQVAAAVETALLLATTGVPRNAIAPHRDAIDGRAAAAADVARARSTTFDRVHLA